ncbi:sulfite exporter TauE/SafE family protein [Paracoccus sp. 11-3]|uniref:Probable membrane transporter protein n=1 Tax=Paracoccus amoyensis TaxID=2760093 RepID=A0A926G7V5_9RHOB|nr:sulfite exporter TauE/SafE family protein [Paracoccus amoyensis]MBC9247468.1 sulfite exporter TauE/SafE family protein [Paracoccus amoyensis]
MTTFLALFAAGIVGGLLLGMIGVGMALVAVPVLIIALPHLGVPGPLAPVVALATSMGIVTIGSIGSVLTHNRLGNIDWPVVRKMVPFSLLGVALGSAVVTLLPAMALRVVFAAFLAFVGLRMLIGKARRDPQPVSANALRTAGGAIGFAGALIGAGGGVFMVPFLNGRGWPMVRAVATSATVGLPVTIFGTIFHALRPLPGIEAPMLGSIHLPALIGIGFGSLLGGPFGARLASRLPGELLKKGFAVLLLILAVELIRH